MPIYDYRCNQCGEVSEILVLGQREDEVKCPICGSCNLERVISASYLLRTENRAPGTTCCARAERCETPPCSAEGICRRD